MFFRRSSQSNIGTAQFNRVYAANGRPFVRYEHGPVGQDRPTGSIADGCHEWHDERGGGRGGGGKLRLPVPRSDVDSSCNDWFSLADVVHGRHRHHENTLQRGRETGWTYRVFLQALRTTAQCNWNTNEYSKWY